MTFHNQKQERKQWSSRFGFVMALVGSAVGLGNLWRFPYVAGQNGGAVFLIVYVIMTILLGYMVMTAELAVGRNAQSNVVAAFGKKKKPFAAIGIFAVFICFIIVSYYSLIGGWLMRYMGGYLTGGGFVSQGGSNEAFSTFINSPWQTILCFTIFMAIVVLVIIGGVRKGIEKVSKFMMPALFVLLIFVMIVSLCMDGAGEGVKFFLVPDWGRIQAEGGIWGIIVAAMGQSFFSLSVGMGISATYGSYVSKKENIPKNTLLVCVADTLVAIVAGFAILPAVFAVGETPEAGSKLLFIILPRVFETLGWFGNVVGFLFFLLVFFAAVTSAISLLEVVVASVHETLGIKRTAAALLVGALCYALGCVIAISQTSIMHNVDLLTWFDDIINIVLLPLSALLICLYVGHVWPAKNALYELSNDGTLRFSWGKLWIFMIKFVVPIMIVVLWVMGFVDWIPKLAAL